MPPRAVWKIRLSGGRAEPLDVRAEQRLPLPWIRERRHALRDRQQFPEPVARVTPTGRRGPYLNAGTGPFEAPARRQLDAPGLDIVGYPGQPAAFRFACVRLFLDDNRSAPDMKSSCSADIFRSRRKQ
jgi:hypothetical protein